MAYARQFKASMTKNTNKGNKKTIRVTNKQSKSNKQRIRVKKK